jgi:hydroxyethylthiazole kinase-like sugar kinase family protein
MAGGGDKVLKTVQDCIAKGAQVNLIYEGNTPLKCCTARGDAACKIVAALLGANAGFA